MANDEKMSKDEFGSDALEDILDGVEGIAATEVIMQSMGIRFRHLYFPHFGQAVSLDNSVWKARVIFFLLPSFLRPGR